MLVCFIGKHMDSKMASRTVQHSGLLQPLWRISHTKKQGENDGTKRLNLVGKGSKLVE